MLDEENDFISNINCIINSNELSLYKCTNNTSFDSKIKIIECRVEFVRVGNVDTFRECYSATVKIRSKWYENEIITEYNPNLHWNPCIYIENAISNTNDEVKYKTSIMNEKTEITEIRTCYGEY